MDVLDLETARWLVHDGLDHVAVATHALDQGASDLAVVAQLRSHGLTPAMSSAVMGAAKARQRARDRWTHAEQLLFTREALEQASDPAVSTWRTQRLADTEAWDLCAGLGGDAIAAAGHGAAVTAVDLDAARLELLRHNAAVTGVEVAIRHGDAVQVQVPGGAFVHVDPGRRRDGRRVRRLAEYVPPVAQLLQAHGAAPGLGIVLSPAVDLADPDLPADAELEFVQAEGQLRETVAWTGALRTPGVTARATLLPGGHSRIRPADTLRQRCPVGPPGAVLVEVAPAAVRARLHDEIGLELGARRLADTRALLTVDALPPVSPWYRRHTIHAVLPAHPKGVRDWLRSQEVDAIEFVAHGLPLDATVWWRALGRPPRGPAGWRIELVRTDDGGRVLVTRDVTTGPV